MRILIVEDDKDLLNAIKEYLVPIGYICDEAPTYRQAFERISVCEYDF